VLEVFAECRSQGPALRPWRPGAGGVASGSGWTWRPPYCACGPYLPWRTSQHCRGQELAQNRPRCCPDRIGVNLVPVPGNADVPPARVPHDAHDVDVPDADRLVAVSRGYGKCLQSPR
jgi:hypothetical protein